VSSTRIPFALLRLLADGQFHSGEVLAREFGCTRGAVWYRIRGVEALGLQVHKVRGRGYRLAEPLDLLDATELKRVLAERAPSLSLELMDECESTNTWLMQRIGVSPSGRVVACEHQSAGRGRRGNQWTSGVGASLTFSLAWRFACGTAALSGLSLAVAVAVADALEACGIGSTTLKWPNDLLHEGRKFGGILIEVSGDPQGASGAVIGVGLNVRLPAALAGSIARPVTDIATLHATAALRMAQPSSTAQSSSMAQPSNTAPPSRTALLAAILVQLAGALPRYEREGFAAFREGWLARHAHAGRQVSIMQGERVLTAGEAVGVAEDGALLLRSARGVERVHSGEVSLR
jgi:BirA family biotin operon repressor/biotin-[acetyl-CoA-carboxylase] ligase